MTDLEIDKKISFLPKSNQFAFATTNYSINYKINHQQIEL